MSYRHHVICLKIISTDPLNSHHYAVPVDIIDDKLNLVQVMAWCLQTSSIYGHDIWRHMTLLGHNDAYNGDITDDKSQGPVY